MYSVIEIIARETDYATQRKADKWQPKDKVEKFIDVKALSRKHRSSPTVRSSSNENFIGTPVHDLGGKFQPLNQLSNEETSLSKMNMKSRDGQTTDDDCSVTSGEVIFCHMALFYFRKLY